MISVYCDGSSSAKGGKPGGWAWVIVMNQGSPNEKVLGAGYGGEVVATNNTMELRAAIEGITALKELYSRGLREREGEASWDAELVSDSQYALNMANGGWTPSRDADGNVKNGDLILQLQSGAMKWLSRDPEDPRRPRTRWVPGHTGDTWNERCDSLAKKGKEEAKLRASKPGSCGCGSAKYAPDHPPHVHSGFTP